MTSLHKIWKKICDDVKGWDYLEDSVDLAAYVLLCAAVVSLVLLLGNIWLNTPTVVFNARDHSCVEVKFAAPEINCENLPKRYEIEWVNK